MKRVFLDPGHGGSDSGGVSRNGVLEKDIALDVALRLSRCLIRYGTVVSLSREKDVYVSLADRSVMANRWNAGVYVGIHCNTSEDETAQGTETWVPGPGHGYNRFGPSMVLAYMIQRYLAAGTGRRDRGVKFLDVPGQEFYALHSTRMPSCLIEMAFITNPYESDLLENPWYREQTAMAVVWALLKFLEIPPLEACEGWGLGT
ncbi:MAG: N-acetylmuramoyl-L-alanine amidase [Bacillota bacterium]